MLKRIIGAGLAIVMLAAAASAHAACSSLSSLTLQNGATADANQTMAYINCMLVSPTLSGTTTFGAGGGNVAADSNYLYLRGQNGIVFQNLAATTTLGSINPGGNMTVYGAISAGGLQSHNGAFGAPFGGNVMNLWWDGACVYIYVDVTPFSITCPSDRRIKNNISSIPDGAGLSTISQLHPVSFYWANKATTLQPNAQYGFLAQELQSVLPNLVTNTGMKTPQTPDGMLRVDYNGLVAPIVKAIQDLKALNDQQAAEIQALQTQFAAYEKAHP